MKAINKILSVVILSLSVTIGLLAEGEFYPTDFAYSEDPLIQATFEIGFAEALLKYPSNDADTNDWVTKLKDEVQSIRRLLPLAIVCINDNYADHLEEYDRAMLKGKQEGNKLVANSSQEDDHFSLAAAFYSLERFEDLLCSEFEKDYVLEKYPGYNRMCRTNYTLYCRDVKTDIKTEL